LVPLCGLHHAQSGEARTTQRAAFERHHKISLRAEADRIALEHPKPLGLRGLAAKWPDVQRYDRDALVGWTRRHLAKMGPMSRVGYAGEVFDQLDAQGSVWTLCEAAGFPRRGPAGLDCAAVLEAMARREITDSEAAAWVTAYRQRHQDGAGTVRAQELRRWLRGQVQPPALLVAALADLLGVSADEILIRETEI
jgi:hypothetical protein